MLTEQDAVVKILDGAEIPHAVLKGSSLSVCYRQPDSRPLGDIDLLVRPEDLERVRDLMMEAGFSLMPEEHSYHIGLYRGKTVLEVHFAMSRPHRSGGGKLANEVMVEFDRQVRRESLSGHSFPALDEGRQALSLLLHMESHLSHDGLGLRQFCDWAVFAASVPGAQFTGEILPLLESCGLGRFARVVTRCCVTYLGLPAELVGWCMDAPVELCDGMMSEMLRTGNMGRSVHTVDLGYMMKSPQENKRSFGAFWANIRALVKRSYPVLEKFPMLFPFCLVHRFMLFLWRLVRKKGTFSRLMSSLFSAKSRETLYDQMHLFETE